MNRRLLVVGATLLGLLAFSGSAGAQTLGITTAPASATPYPCLGTSGAVIQTGDSNSTPFIVPAGGGTITQWQILTAGDTPGATITLVVVAPSGGSGSYTVVATDTETIPSPLPSNGIASFTLAQPIQVAAGDTFGLSATGAVRCYFGGGTVPAGDAMESAVGSLAVGSTLTESTNASSLELTIALTLLTSQDSAVQTSAVGAPASTGSPFVLASTVTNNGPQTSPITFTDQVPAGLQILSATAGLGACTVSGQTVTCTITGLGAGKSSIVDVVVTAPAPGSYTNTVSVANTSGVPDQNSGNNLTSATAVVAALPQQCIVPGLKKLPLAGARTLLKELGCGVKVRSKHSSIGKGLVIGTTQKTGTYPLKQVVTLIVSSGAKKRKKRRALER
jgi:uncharacterized repeat protein (TIGR01451 family)